MNPFLGLVFGLLEKAGAVAFTALANSGKSAEEQEKLWNERVGRLEYKAMQVEAAKIVHPPKPLQPPTEPG